LVAIIRLNIKNIKRGIFTAVIIDLRSQIYNSATYKYINIKYMQLQEQKVIRLKLFQRVLKQNTVFNLGPGVA
jgi:hypothetical protein